MSRWKAIVGITLLNGVVAIGYLTGTLFPNFYSMAVQEADASSNQGVVQLAQFEPKNRPPQKTITSRCMNNNQAINTIFSDGSVNCITGPMESAPDFTLWASPLSMIPTGSNAQTLSLERGFFGNTLRVSSTGTGDLKWIHLPLQLESRYKIKGVILCYQLTDPASFISQIRLSRENEPPSATVLLDDPTDRLSTVATCVTSNANLPVTGSMGMGLRLNFGSTNARIDIGAIGIILGA